MVAGVVEFCGVVCIFDREVSICVSIRYMQRSNKGRCLPLLRPWRGRKFGTDERLRVPGTIRWPAAVEVRFLMVEKNWGTHQETPLSPCRTIHRMLYYLVAYDTVLFNDSHLFASCITAGTVRSARYRTVPYPVPHAGRLERLQHPDTIGPSLAREGIK